jgi:hypothetical protein
MISENARNVFVNTIGVAAIVISAFLLLWLGTVGVMIGFMNLDFNKSPAVFIGVLLGGIIGCVMFTAGIKILRRNPWSRIALMVIWGLISAIVVIIILFCISSIFERIGALVFWLIIAILGIAQIVFLKSGSVKELFKNDL